MFTVACQELRLAKWAQTAEDAIGDDASRCLLQALQTAVAASSGRTPDGAAQDTESCRHSGDHAMMQRDPCATEICAQRSGILDG